MSARLMMIRHWHLRNGHKPRDGHDYCEGCAHEMDDLLKHMDAAGFAVVPVEPTDKMAMAFHEAQWRAPQDRTYMRRLEDFADRYKAMLKAAQEDSRE